MIAALEEVLRLLEARTEGEGEGRITDGVRTVAEELLLLQLEQDPESLPRARKPATWAAGALHAAFMELRSWTAGDRRMTLEEVGERFGVSAGSVSRRSRQLRESAENVHFLPFPADSPRGRLLTRILEERARRPDA